MEYPEALETVRDRFGAHAGTDEAIAFMRSAGLSIIQCIKAVRELTGCPLNEAKFAVHTSVAWADLRAVNERLDEEPVRAAGREIEFDSHQPVEFRGLEPWPADSDNLYIECETDAGLIDLHNFYQLSDVVLRLTEGAIFLVLARVDLDGTPAHCPPFAVLGFLDVRELEVKQAEDFDVRAAVDFEYVMYYLREGAPSFTVMTGDSLFFFRASTVVFDRYDTQAEALTWRTTA